MYVRQGKYEVAAKILEKELDILTGNVPIEENSKKNVLSNKIDVIRSKAVSSDNLNVTQSSSINMNDVSDNLIHNDNATRNGDNSNSNSNRSRVDDTINGEGENGIKNENQSILTSKNEKNKNENNVSKASVKEAVEENVKILTYENKMKIIELRTTLANIYSTHLSNVRRAGYHYDMILELGGDMTKGIRMFFAKNSKELETDRNEYHSNSTMRYSAIQENEISGNGTFQNVGSSSTVTFDSNNKTMNSNNLDFNNTNNNQNIKTDSNDINLSEASAAHVKLRERTTESSPVSTNSDTTSTALPGSTSFSTSSQPTRILERAGFSLSRWVVRSEKEKSNSEILEQENENDMAPRGKMKMSGMKGNEEKMGDREGGKIIGSGSGSGGSNVIEGESAFEAQVRMNEEPDDDDGDDGYSMRGGGGGSGGQSSVLSAMSSNRRGRA